MDKQELIKKIESQIKQCERENTSFSTTDRIQSANIIAISNLYLALAKLVDK